MAQPIFFLLPMKTDEMTIHEIYLLEVWLLENVFGWKPDEANTTEKPAVLSSPLWILALQQALLKKLPMSMELSFTDPYYFISRPDQDTTQSVMCDDLGLALGVFARRVFDHEI